MVGLMMHLSLMKRNIGHISGSVQGAQVDVAPDDELVAVAKQEDTHKDVFLEDSINYLGPLEFKPR